jgi:cytochrome b subunit of formate dehydrogenase
MIYSWITPILSWVASNVLTKSDFQRIENNIAYLQELLG